MEMTHGSTYDTAVRLISITLAAALLAACGSRPDVLTFSGSVVGAEGEIVRRQIERFREQYPDVEVEIRVTPDAADQRHQLYVQWLNAWAEEPDVLQLDVIWTPEFGAAGWILDLDRFGVPTREFFSAAIAALPIRRISSLPPSRPTAGRGSSTRCRGSSTSACSTGAPT
jgi:ABC-type glycerol-3-phosphate transport system substrate-binding protein